MMQPQAASEDIFADAGGETAAGAAAAAAGSGPARLPELSQQQSSDFGAAMAEGYNPFAAMAEGYNPFAAMAEGYNPFAAASGATGALHLEVDVAGGQLDVVEDAVTAMPAGAADAAGAAGDSDVQQGAWSVDVQLLSGSMVSEALRSPSGWGGLCGCDVAALVEVVEHLEPGALDMLGPCLLGG
jgi:hypothetical protein